ncbi:hypothetical protein LXT12_25575 [Pelomonas sp. P7]|uniref:Uncharacterized protein n=1 Tax=Pelomonas caseinilytica TaxID=2906763 RepID=A0ABS8XTT2_9BURK|nr:hypothetical protein [Pelomonas sp. P7]MCE4540615.1 hypothetical protein [Pelomonas sp. P7]
MSETANSLRSGGELRDFEAFEAIEVVQVMTTLRFEAPLGQPPTVEGRLCQRRLDNAFHG